LNGRYEYRMDDRSNGRHRCRMDEHSNGHSDRRSDRRLDRRMDSMGPGDPYAMDHGRRMKSIKDSRM
jgi:hypothetical protein